MEIIIITGAVNSGKTTLLRDFFEKEKSQGNFPTGIIAPGIFENGIKTGFEVIDLSSGESKILASTEKDKFSGFQAGKFFFSSEAFEFAKKALLNFEHKVIVFLDEVGPLELEGKGYADCLKVLLESDIQKLYLVIRSSVLRDFLKIYLTSRKFTIKYFSTRDSIPTDLETPQPSAVA